MEGSEGQGSGAAKKLRLCVCSRWGGDNGLSIDQVGNTATYLKLYELFCSIKDSAYLGMRSFFALIQRCNLASNKGKQVFRCLKPTISAENFFSR